MAQRGHNIDPTPTDIGAKEAQARNYLENRYRQERSNQIDGTRDVHVRDLNPGLDLESGSDNSWGGTGPVFEQTGLTTANNPNQVYVVDSDEKAENAMIAIVAVTLRGSSEAVEIRFETSPGGEFERLQVQGAYTDDEATVLLNTPVFYGLNDDGAIEVWVEADSDENIVFQGYTAEKSGTELARANEQFVPGSSGGGGGGGTGGGA